MADGLTVLGVENRVHDDGIDIVGRADDTADDGPLYGGGRVDSLGDHRIAMAFTVAGLRAADEILVEDCTNVATSFPGFLDLVKRLGMHVVEEAS